MNCYNCDTILDDNWNYCPNCKGKIKNIENDVIFVATDETGKCHTCSCELDEKWNFCPICGTSVDFYENGVIVEVPILANVEVPTVVVPISSVNNNEVKERQEENQVVDGKAVSSRYCPNCGAVVLEQHLFCSSCGYRVVYNNTSQNVIPANNVLQVVSVEPENYNYIFWMLLAFFAVLIGFLVTITTGSYFGLLIGYVVSLFSMIYVKVKYPKNAVVTAFFWIFVGLSIFALIYIIIGVFCILACMYCVEGLGG